MCYWPFQRAASILVVGLLLAADCQQFDVEVQVGVRGDHTACAVGAVAHAAGHMQHAALAEAHLHHAGVPTGDDLADTDLKLEGLVAVPGGVELQAVIRQGARVVHGQQFTCLGEGLAIAILENLERQAAAQVLLGRGLRAPPEGHAGERDEGSDGHRWRRGCVEGRACTEAESTRLLDVL
eukprot:CAMPEP_0177451482 /NCGR_PEP_ID=MMETSP0369-20130122/9795_1 /TAXON_ID=447022 ORGANISM="Scrippsiella hangoei-like, Strain SHHI-4" /NCGR_SAMPLE_ID=MMETSP0369 /ASSEMBLY_ACC=CAM_ASM_000364 /LENGTH=180 /DNA_ID=CAMNT_0018924085 /DNA_START=136 /DNA_END=675 /DNA_ORIENTATION=+